MLLLKVDSSSPGLGKETDPALAPLQPSGGEFAQKAVLDTCAVEDPAKSPGRCETQREGAFRPRHGAQKPVGQEASFIRAEG